MKKFIDIPKDEYFKKITKYQFECPFDQSLSCQSVIRKNADGESYFIASIKTVSYTHLTLPTNREV